MDNLSGYKKILLVAGFLAIVAALGYLIYFLFFKPVTAPPASEQPETGTTTGRFPPTGTGTPQIVTDEGEQALPPIDAAEETPSPVANGGVTETSQLNNDSSLGATLAGNGSELQYYNQADGKFYRVNQNGDAVPLTDKVFHNVSNITWSGAKNSAILEYPDGANIFYDFNTNNQVTLPKHWEDFNFSPDGTQVVMKSIGLDPDNRWLAISSPDGSKVRPVEPLGDKNDTVYPAWSPNNQIVAMFTEAIGFDRQEVYFVGQNNENFKSTIIEGRGFEPKWSPTENRLLYSVYSSDTDMKPGLWLVSAEGDNIGTGRKNLNLETWADKCAFANDTELYCAVPEQLETGAGLFPELAANTKDNLYKIDAQTGLKRLIAVPNGDYNMSDLIISKDGYYLYFTDKTTKKLNKIKLK